MTDDNLEPTPKPLDGGIPDPKLNLLRLAKTEKCGQLDLPNRLHKDIWNRAIEKAAKVVKHSGYHQQILDLKI